MQLKTFTFVLAGRHSISKTCLTVNTIDGYNSHFYTLPPNNQPLPQLLGTLCKPRRQREPDKTKGLMSRTMALHVHYKLLYISQLSCAKQQRGITTFCVFKTT